MRPSSTRLCMRVSEGLSAPTRCSRNARTLSSFSHTFFLPKRSVFDKDLSTAQELDIGAAASCYIIFEGVDINERKSGVRNSFQNSFMESMIANVPCVVIASQNSAFGSSLPAIADLLHRGIPTLLLDLRERWPLFDAPPDHTCVTDFAKVSHCSEIPHDLNYSIEEAKKPKSTRPLLEASGAANKKAHFGSSKVVPDEGVFGDSALATYGAGPLATAEEDEEGTSNPLFERSSPSPNEMEASDTIININPHPHCHSNHCANQYCGHCGLWKQS